MGRTVPSSRIVLAEEKQEWKPFRNALDKSEWKEFDENVDISKLYVSACSNSVQLVPLDPIVISILFHHYKELIECQKQIKLMDDNNSIGIINDLKEELQNDMGTEEDRKTGQEQQQQQQQLTLFDFKSIRR